MNIRDLLSQPRDLFEKYCESKAHYAYLGPARGLARVLGKYLLYIDPQDTSLAPHLIVEGYWESWVTLALARLKGGGLAVDVGANQGYFTMVLAELFDSVYAFEPQHDLAHFVRDSARVNGFTKKVDVRELAINDEPRGVAALEAPGDARNRGSVRIADSIPGASTAALTTTLDSFLKNTPPVQFIKIDAEGSEEKIWAGGRGVIERDRPIILMEFSPESYVDPEGFLAEIQGWYPLREVDTDGGLVAVTPEEVLGRGDFSMLWLERE